MDVVDWVLVRYYSYCVVGTNSGDWGDDVADREGLLLLLPPLLLICSRRKVNSNRIQLRVGLQWMIEINNHAEENKSSG